MVSQLLRARLSRILPKARSAAALILIIAGVGLPPASAQEGHPLKGSWLGTWEANDVHGEFVLIVLDWDGRNITGVINPGTDNIQIDNATLNPEGWVLRIEADTQDDSGNTLHYEIEGRIENLELPNRSVVGTWKHERGSGAFDISRQ